MTRPLGILAIALVLGAAGCDEGDLTSLRVTLEEDLSGTITVTSIAVPPAPAAPEREASGVAWSRRLQVSAASGRFGSLSEVAVGGIVFDASIGDQGMGRLEVEIPLDDRRWAGLLAPITAAQRAELATLMDPSGRAGAIGEAVKLTVTLPGEFVSQGVFPRGEGLAVSRADEMVTLIVPVEPDLPNHRRLVWHVTWRQPDPVKPQP